MSKLNGCHNRADFKETVRVQIGWEDLYIENSFTRIPAMQKIPDPMSRDCQYSLLTRNDPGCEGCRHKRTDFPVEGTDV